MFARPKPAAQVDVAALFEAHAPFLLRTVERLTGPGAHVEDIVQEAFLTVHVKRDSLAADTQWRGWLYGVTLNIIQHHRRSFARRQRLEEAVLREPGSDSMKPDDVAQRLRDRERVRQAVLGLPLPQREVFVLFELESVSGQDIATLLEIPENTVWSRLRLARAAFKDAVLKRSAAPEVRP